MGLAYSSDCDSLRNRIRDCQEGGLLRAQICNTNGLTMYGSIVSTEFGDARARTLFDYYPMDDNSGSYALVRSLF